MVILLSLLLLGSLALSEYCARFEPAAGFYLLPSRSWEFLIGGLLCYLPTAALTNSRLCCFLSIAGCTIIFFAAFGYQSDSRFPGVAAILPCAGAALLIASNTHKLTIVGRVLAWNPIVFVGLISYSLYLWHWPLLAFVRYGYLYTLPRSLTMVILAASFLAAYLSWRYVETPLRHSQAFKQGGWALGGVMATVPLLLGLSCLVMAGKGFPDRLPPVVLKFLVTHPTPTQKANDPLLDDLLEYKLASFGNREANLSCLVWGDSHASHLVPGIEAACNSRNIKGYLASYPSTAPILDFVTQYPFSLREKAPAFSRFVVDFAKKNHCEFAIMHGKWSTYATIPAFELHLQETIDELTLAGVKVAVVLDVALMDANVPRVMARNLWFGLYQKKVGVPVDKHLAKNYQAVEIINRVCKGKATVLDPAPFFTKDPGFWAGEMDGKPLYYDRDHINPDGSILLQSLFEGYFDSILSIK